MFFGRGVLEVVGLFYHGPLEVGGESRAMVFQTVRFFWALCSLATVILVFGILAALYVGLAPITLQQAHFFTVDSLSMLLGAVLGRGSSGRICGMRGWRRW